MKRTIFAILTILAVLSALFAACTPGSNEDAIPAIGTAGGTTEEAATEKFTAEQATPAQETTEEETTAETPSLAIPLGKGYTLGIENEETLQILSDLFTEADNANAAVYCYDKDSGKAFCSDSEVTFHTQSTIKAPYIMAILCSLGDNAATGIQERLTLRQTQIKDGMGTVKNSPVGTSFSVRDLMTRAITISDNTAYQMLYDRYGDAPFNALAQQTGIPARLNGSQFCYCSVEEMGYLFRAIWENDYPEKEFLLEQLGATQNNFLISSALPGRKIAHKYGLATGMGDCHDAAIVYGEHPYVLVIFSKYNPAAADPYASFRALAKKTDAAHDALRQRD